MGISYSAYTFYGVPVPKGWQDDEAGIYDLDDVLRPLELRKIVEEETGIKIGYIGLHGYDQPATNYLTFGKVYGGYMDDSSSRVLKGERISDTVDEDHANWCLAEVFEKLGWEFPVGEAGWYTGGAIS